MTKQIKYLFSKEHVSVLLKKKKIFNKQGPRETQHRCAIGGSLDKEKAPQNRTENRSQYGIRLREFKKIMNLYTNISKKYLKTRIKSFHNTPTKIEENFFRYLESRLDVVLCRASFFDSIRSARQAIRSGEILVNRIAVKTPAQILKPGDLVSLLQKEENSYFRNRKNLNKEILSPFKKVEALLFENIFKKRKDDLSLQSLTDLILFSTKTEALTEAFSCFRKINLSQKSTVSNNLVSGSSFTNTTKLCSDSEKIEPSEHTTFNRNTRSNITFNTTSESLLLKNTAIENLFQNNLPSYAKDILNCDFLRQPSAEERKVKIENSHYAIIRKPLSSFNCDFTNEDCFIVINYYLYLKRVLQKNWRMKQGHSFKGTSTFKKGKPTHLEISYTSLSIVFLFPPQFIKFPDFINYSDIFK